MFTGIIQALGTVRAISKTHLARRLVIDSGTLDLGDVTPGDSIAVSGPCLTVTELGSAHFAVDVSPETLHLTTLGTLGLGVSVNLEKALTLSSRLGGHLVSGHVDGVGTILERERRGEFIFFRIESPATLSRYIAPKGSISVEGVSLTVNAVTGDDFDLLLIPHTLAQTTLGRLQCGARVNLEVDLIARYLERLMPHSPPTPSLIDAASLRTAGFIK
ncbi:MAG: riboflavin synthase [Gammaproteobacteria bacterium]